MRKVTINNFSNKTVTEQLVQTVMTLYQNVNWYNNLISGNLISGVRMNVGILYVRPFCGTYRGNHRSHRDDSSFSERQNADKCIY